jgi:hypothetical protein
MQSGVFAVRPLHLVLMLDLSRTIDWSLHRCFIGGCWKLYRDGYDERGERYNLRHLQRDNANGAFA